MEMTNLLLKLCLIKYKLYINVFNLENRLILIVDSLQKWLAHSITNREYSNFTLLNLGKLRYLSHYLSGKCLNGSVVNRGLSILLRESLESTLSPFKQKKNILYTVWPKYFGDIEKFTKCRLDNFSMGFILLYLNLCYCKINKYAVTVF